MSQIGNFSNVRYFRTHLTKLLLISASLNFTQKLLNASFNPYSIKKCFIHTNALRKKVGFFHQITAHIRFTIFQELDILKRVLVEGYKNHLKVTRNV